MTRLSPDDKSAYVDELLMLDDVIIEVGKGYWVEIHAKVVGPTAQRPHGIDYGLCLLAPNGRRLVCYDNAHSVKHRGKRSKGIKPIDHKHVRKATRPYQYQDALTLLTDFWSDVYETLKREGVP